MSVTKGKAQAIVNLQKIRVETARISLAGDSPLLCHRFSQKMKAEILAKQQKKAKPRKEAKDPEAQYRESLYPYPEGGYGFPVLAFKNAAVGACRYADGVRMTEARGAFHVIGDHVMIGSELYELARIEGEPEMHESVCHVGMGTADLRYRGVFPIWTTTLRVDYNVNALSLEQIVNLLNTAGFGIGVGEWRPERNGRYGMFSVESSEAPET